MQNLNGTLTKLGFSSIADRIYLVLIKRGELSIADISKHAGKHRPAIYRALPELLAAGLVSRVAKGRRTIYRAESPVALSAIQKKQAEEIDTAIPELANIFQGQSKKLKISFFDGTQGIASAYERVVGSLPKGGALYRYESPKDYSCNKKFYPSLYWKRAGASGDVDKYVITNEKTNQKRHGSLNRFSKALNIPFEENITQIIGGDKVMFVDYETESVALIENQRFADFQKELFKIFFKKL